MWLEKKYHNGHVGDIRKLKVICAMITILIRLQSNFEL